MKRKQGEVSTTCVAALNTLVFETFNLATAAEELKKRGVKILGRVHQSASGNYLVIEDPFGNVSELLEVAK